MDRRMNALPTNRQTDGHSHIQRCVGAPKNETVMCSSEGDKFSWEESQRLSVDELKKGERKKNVGEDEKSGKYEREGEMNRWGQERKKNVGEDEQMSGKLD